MRTVYALALSALLPLQPARALEQVQSCLSVRMPNQEPISSSLGEPIETYRLGSPLPSASESALITDVIEHLDGKAFGDYRKGLVAAKREMSYGTYYVHNAVSCQTLGGNVRCFKSCVLTYQNNSDR